MRKRNDERFAKFVQQHNEAYASRMAEEAAAQHETNEAFADKFLAGMISGLDLNKEAEHG